MMGFDESSGGAGFLELAMGVMTWCVVQQTGADPEEVYGQLLLNRPAGATPITPQGVYEMMATTARHLP